jgi:hypothetical protein
MQQAYQSHHLRCILSIREATPAIKSSPMNITHASTKADIIDASCEVIDTQAEQINDLKERQLILWTIVGILTVLLAFGA